MTIPPGSTNSSNPEQQISSPQREDQTSEDPSRLKDFDDRNDKPPTVHRGWSDLDITTPGRQDNRIPPTPSSPSYPVIPPTPASQIAMDMP